MNVAFWSNEHEKSGAFTNFVATAIASVIREPYTITILENYLARENISKAFFSHSNIKDISCGGTGFYEGSGIEGLLRRIYRGDNFPDLLSGYLKEVIPKHLYYIPQCGFINSEIYDYELYDNINELLSIIKRNTDLCYINLIQENHLSSNAILQHADIIVINLYQDTAYLQNFFKNYHSLKSKSLFVIGNYSPNSLMTCKRISALYDIPLNHISPIPFNKDYDLACKYGRAKEFINKYYYCSKNDPNYMFIQGVKRLAYIISKKREETIVFDKKELEYCGI